MNALFANNKNLNFQIKYIIVLANEQKISKNKKEILIKKNIIY